MKNIIERFSQIIQSMINQSAASIGCPIDFSLAGVLANLSTIVGGSHELEIKKNYRVKGNIFIAVIADAGAKKTPSLSLVTEPIKRYQEKLFDDFMNRLEETEDNSSDLKPQQIFTTDSTIESLNEILNVNKHGILVYKDELAGFFKSLNQYKTNGVGSDMEKYLSFWTGDDVMVNRKSLQLPSFIKRPIVTILGGIQPAVIPTLPNFKNNGFQERYLYVYPEHQKYEYSTFIMDDNVAENYYDLSIKLLKKYHAISISQNPRIVRFSEQANNIWIKWASKHNEEMSTEVVPNYLVSCWSKLESYCARLALLMELAQEKYLEDDCNEVSLYSLETAIFLVDYFKENARKVWRLFSEDPSHDKDLQKLKDLINRKKDRNGFITRREVLNTKILGVKRNEDVEGLFEDLELVGFGKRTSRKSSSGKDVLGFIVKGSKTYNC